MNTTNGNFNELDEMKQQMQMLQDKFQKEVTINDRLIQESIRHKMSWNKKLFWSDIISIPILIFIQLVMTEVFQLSWWNLGIFTAVVLAIVFADYKINVSTLRDEDLQRNNLIETAKTGAHEEAWENRMYHHFSLGFFMGRLGLRKALVTSESAT